MIVSSVCSLSIEAENDVMPYGTEPKVVSLLESVCLRIPSSPYHSVDPVTAVGVRRFLSAWRASQLVCRKLLRPKDESTDSTAPTGHSRDNWSARITGRERESRRKKKCRKQHDVESLCTYSHAEAALACRMNVGVQRNLQVIQEPRRRRRHHSTNLHRLGRTDPGGSEADENGEQNRKERGR